MQTTPPSLPILTTLPRVFVREGQVTRGVVVRIEKGGKLLGIILDAQRRGAISNGSDVKKAF